MARAKKEKKEEVNSTLDPIEFLQRAYIESFSFFLYEVEKNERVPQDEKIHTAINLTTSLVGALFDMAKKEMGNE